MLYLEHRFVIRRTETVAAISMSRVCFERHNMNLVLERYPGGAAAEKPEYPQRLRTWIEALSESSQDLMGV